ncbi:MAG TPA: hypothetical protein V6D17_21570 [Candidatus Obscuribacterales bacterium]
MDIFAYLKDDWARIMERLTDTVDNFADWPHERVFEETKRDLEALRQHFEKEVLIEQNLRNTTGVEGDLQKVTSLRKEIANDINNLVMIHIDEPGFEDGLEEITKKAKELRDFCESTFYPRVNEKMSESELRHLNQQVSEIVMS